MLRAVQRTDPIDETPTRLHGSTSASNGAAGGVVGAAAGSLFVFKGKYRAVLINYPNQNEKENILTTANFLS